MMIIKVCGVISLISFVFGLIANVYFIYSAKKDNENKGIKNES